MAHNKGLQGGNHRTRPYGFMLMLAFGAALLGAVLLHKLRERRALNLLVKEKDRELLALQLLLQMERDRTKEIEGKNEEMKAKIYALRGQKMELDKRVSKMKSTMDSLKEEQRVMESAFEEKQNETRMLQGQEKKNEGSQDDSDSGATGKGKKGEENKTMREEHPGAVENNAYGGGAVRKHGHASRTMGKHRRMNGMNMEAREQEVKEMRQLEEQEGSFVQEDRNGKLVNEANKNAGQVKPNMLHEQPEELQEKKEVVDGGNVHEDEDDFFKES